MRLERLLLLSLVSIILGTLSARYLEAAPPGNGQPLIGGFAQPHSVELQLAAIEAAQARLQQEALAAQQAAVKRQLAAAVPKAVAQPTPISPVVPVAARAWVQEWAPAEPLPVISVQSVATCDPLEESEITKLVETAAAKHTLPASLLKSVMRQESAFRPCAQSLAGAMGLMQIMPDTAADLGVSDPFDPAQNVDAGARFLKQMLNRYNGDTVLALSAYNAGPTTVDRAGGVPPISETIDYVSKVLGGLPVLY